MPENHPETPLPSEANAGHLATFHGLHSAKEPDIFRPDCAECLDIADAQEADVEGPTCSICDGLGHGYLGGGPCPLEVTDYSGEPWWAL